MLVFDAREVYRAYVTAIMVVAFAIAGYTMLGGFDTPYAVVIPQMGTVVEGRLPGNFNDSIILDTSQVEVRN